MEKSIFSPKYPSLYPNRASCTWKLTAPLGSNVMLKSFDYNIESVRSSYYRSSSSCGYDSLTIYDGPTTNSQSLAKLCGTSKRFDGILSSSNTIYLKFVSDSSTSYKGFQISYSIVQGKCKWCCGNNVKC